MGTKTQKKNSKGRLDRYYYLAKEKGYRARSSFKLLQINEKYGHFLEKSRVVIDLCAAPGSWCQVASQVCPVNALIIGVDIVQIKPLPNCLTFQSDITTEDCRSKLRGHMKTWKADTVLHDGAPNVGLGWVQDAFTQSQLTLQALKLAVENLGVGGTFVTKIFRSKDYNNLMWIFQQLFDKVEATKPPASRNVSAEIFVVCKGFKAPKRIDPRLLDPKEVFQEVQSGAANNEAKVFNPHKKVRKREGYEEEDYLQFKTLPLVDWVKQEVDVVNILGTLNQFTIDKEDPDWKQVKKMEQTTKEFLECCKDLKVLGKKDFKHLLKWRKKARLLLELDKVEEKEDALVDVEPLDEEAQITKELDELVQNERQKQKREKRKKNEQKQDIIRRMQMNMLTDMQIGVDAVKADSASLFNLKIAERTGKLDDLASGKRAMVFHSEKDKPKPMVIVEETKEVDSETEIDLLENELNMGYAHELQKKIEKNPRLLAKDKTEGDDEEWEGIVSAEERKSSDDDYSDDDSDFDSDTERVLDSLIANRKIEEHNNDTGLSTTAQSFFSDSVFQALDSDEEEEQQAASKKLQHTQSLQRVEEEAENDEELDEAEGSSESEFEIVPPKSQWNEDEMDISDEEEDTNFTKANQKNVDLATVEAMTLAHQVALGRMTKKDLIEEGINKYSFRQTNGLPAWFIDDEKEHSKIVKPITKEASDAIKEKMRELNARPIKKVMEAKGRKKMRALRRFEKMRKKSDLINDDSAKSENDKAEQINALMRRLSKKENKKPKVTLIRATGKNRGVSGRPKGVKGKYKMVDGVLKNEQRALRRIEKKSKNKKKH
ncbi:hypothetical protein LJB42_003172 [Komagataella kurtzmanii]|nr:hypothetical protein LJB42_003172 [Komagataella kurtzmanii]